MEYTADRIRRQFFRDHPFEAMRSQSLVERDTIREPHPVQGKRWERLRQHGRNPSPEECVVIPSLSFRSLPGSSPTSSASAIQFAVSLFEHHNTPLSVAYRQAVAQFRSLRSELAVASEFALHEAKFYGAAFAPNELQRGADLTKRALMTWSRTGGSGRRKSESIRNRFFPVWKARTGAPSYWSRGVGYTKRWVRGMPPMFWPSQEEKRVARAAQRATNEPKRLELQRTAQPTRREAPTIMQPIQ